MIDQKPSFDHIVYVHVDNTPDKPYKISISKKSNILPDISGNVTEVIHLDQNEPMKIKWLKQIYQEFSDLEFGHDFSVI